MKLTKKLAAFAVLSTMAFAMTACGQKTTEEPKQEDTKQEADQAATEAKDDAKDAKDQVKDAVEGKDVKDLKFGISIYKYDDNYMTLFRNEMVRYLKDDLGVPEENIIIQDGKGDQAEQTNQINNFITQGVDVMILNLVQPSSSATITDLANKAGIPVVYINREPDASEESRWDSDDIKASYVGADARQSGTFQGEEILETPNKGDLNGDGKVSYIMIQGDPENIDAQYRTEYSVKALKDAGVEVKELLMQRGDWDQAKGQQIAQDALNQFGKDVEVIFCNNDSMALGAIQAIESAGRKVGEDIYIVGVDALEEAVQDIIDGRMTGTVFQDYITQAQTAVNFAVDYAEGKPVDKVKYVDYVKVTKDNAADLLAKIKK